MLTVVFYDLATGRIESCAQTTERNAEASGKPYITVPEFRVDYDATHRVVGGTLVAIEGER